MEDLKFKNGAVLLAKKGKYFTVYPDQNIAVIRVTVKEEKVILGKKIDAVEESYVVSMNDGKVLSERYHYIKGENPTEFGSKGQPVENHDYLVLEFLDKEYNLKKCQLWYFEDIILETTNISISFPCLNPNPNYVCLQNNRKNSGNKWECIYSIKSGQEVTPRFGAVYPAPDFPHVPYYKATSSLGGMPGGQLKYSLMRWPENKEIFASIDDDISSVGFGVLGGLSNFFYVRSYEFNDKLYEYYHIDKHDNVVSLGSDEKMQEIFGDLKTRMSDRQAIKKLFKR